MTTVGALLRWLALIALSPLFFGLIHRTKAFFAGRRGAPLFQPYYDVVKLVRKRTIYSRTTTWVFRAGPVATLAAILLAAAIVPIAGLPSVLSFEGDILLVAYLLGLARVATILAALDTGSCFEGMGASREAAFGALAEPALFLGLAALARATGSLSLAGIYAGVTPGLWTAVAPTLVLVTLAFFVVLLAENARIPFDDPNTHLELTMIHEVMVLDHGGPLFGWIQFSSAVKFCLFGVLVSGLAVPVRTGRYAIDLAAAGGSLALAAIATGVVESTMARLRLPRVPHLLAGAGALSALAIILLVG